MNATRVEPRARSRDDRIQFGERDQLDLREAVVPRTCDHLVERIDRLLLLAVGIERESEVAIGLRLLRAQIEDLAKHCDRELGLLGLQQAISENAQNVTILEVHLREV